ncbi:hypothetical protein AYO49_06325 [Verrucomicrobiaceae bacterium SCGC AG-212-N21]|nr:hypothetical protein AYO49_06325 [Verrucomicrobiaceae bacterium SCGC AG-212-N21]
MRRVMAGENLQPHGSIASFAQSFACGYAEMTAWSHVAFTQNIAAAFPCIMGHQEVTARKRNELLRVRG